MAIVNPLLIAIPLRQRDPIVPYAWPNMGSADVGAPLQFAAFADRSFQIEGTPGAGFGIVIEGSNDGVNYHTLNDPANIPLSFAGVGVLKQVMEITLYVRPRVTGGDGTTSVTVTTVKCDHAPP